MRRTERHDPTASTGDMVMIAVLFSILFGVAMFGEAMADALWAMMF